MFWRVTPERLDAAVQQFADAAPGFGQARYECWTAAGDIPKLLRDWHVRLADETCWAMDAIDVDGIVSVGMEKRTRIFDASEPVEIVIAPRKRARGKVAA